MHLNPYGEYAVLLAASLANEWPADRAGIVRRTRQFGMTVRFPVGSDDAAAARVVLDGWLAVVDAGDPEERALLLNAHMAAAAAFPRLTDHARDGWHLHYRDAGQSLPQALAAVISVGTALHLSTRGMSRLSRCAVGAESGGGLDDCDHVVVDVTRNGRQRYCSVRCSNRAAVRRHRTRRS